MQIRDRKYPRRPMQALVFRCEPVLRPAVVRAPEELVGVISEGSMLEGDVLGTRAPYRRTQRSYERVALSNFISTGLMIGGRLPSALACRRPAMSDSETRFLD